MANSVQIKKRRSELKKHLLSKNLTIVSFINDVEPLYRNDDFINKFNKVSESVIRSDLKSLGYVYSYSQEGFILESVYFDNEVELRIIKHLYFMDLYQPISVNIIPFDCDETLNTKFSYILLHYKKPTDKTMQQYNISNLLKDLEIYYEYVYNAPNLGELHTICTENYIKFEFLDSDSLDLLYNHLKEWKLKGKEQNPFKKRKIGRTK